MKKHAQSTRENGTRADTRIRIQVGVEIPAPLETVFAYLSDLENNPHWNWAVTATTTLDHRRGRGARYLQEYSWPQDHNILELTAYHPLRLLEFAVRERQEGPVSYRYELAAIDGTSTRLDVRVDLEPTDTASRPAMYRARVEAAIAANIEDLRTVLIEAQKPAAIPVGR